MRRIRSFFAVSALLLTLSLAPLSGTASLANAASSTHATAAVHIHPNIVCPHGGPDDC